jgi:hypothetical protein
MSTQLGIVIYHGRKPSGLVEGGKRNKEQGRVPDVSFGKEEGYKHNFVFLKVRDVS